MKIILLGPPGSGKGTIAKKLVQDFKLNHISSGDVFREEIGNKTALGREVQQVIEQGKLVSDRLTTELIKPRLIKKDNYILDGFPRTVAQAESIADQGISLVLLIDVPDKTVVERITLRRICPDGHIYHLKYIPPKKEGFCDLDGKPLLQRKDDTEEVVKKRLKAYHKQTKPLIDYYKRKKLLKTVGGAQQQEEVYRSVKKALL